MGTWACPDCGRLNQYYPYPTRCSRCGYLHTPGAVLPAVGEVKVPPVLYRGQAKGYVPKLEDLPLSTRHESSQLGFFATVDKEAAGFYAGKTGEVVSVSLDIKNPYLLSQQEYGELTNKAKASALRNKLIKEGYDGVYYEYGNEWIAFYPEQIKPRKPPTPTVTPEVTKGKEILKEVTLERLPGETVEEFLTRKIWAQYELGGRFGPKVTTPAPVKEGED